MAKYRARSALDSYLQQQRTTARRRIIEPSGSRSARVHVAAVCYRLSDQHLEFLLVRTQSGRWTFPKGGVDDDPTFAAAASREAYEEAGVRGRVEHRPFASYLHRKARAPKTREMEVAAHLCKVVCVEPALEPNRHPTWFTFQDAKKRVRENRGDKYAAELERVLDQARRRIHQQARS